ncbi:hypothetical protein BFR04_09695 [Gaetbulibacter sp. 4G1]|nr:DUF2235 domain-containing protein [Gaetbulibacter sp. 4G1]PIA77699.1 hypothetical protein BFR04_09695 [Gaetbulibacter sp. 4G1]
MRAIFLLLFTCLFFNCGKAVYHLPLKTNSKPKKLLVFIDGTGNSESSNTNIAKLYNLVTLQENKNIQAVYIEGVGTKGKVIGLATGWGIGEDVRIAYQFLVDNYKKENKDEIYIFGFSRGAYAARILAGFVDVAGVFDLSKLDKKKKKETIKKLYRTYKEKNANADERREEIAKKFKNFKSQTDVNIEFMGLWDTVEALGLPNSKEDYKRPNTRYNDQLCNVKKAAHALSLNDQRAYLFTPILLTEKHLFEKCKRPIDIDKKVEEVWFFGAHSDVGGGYKNTFIPNYSLNWMIKKIHRFCILKKETKTYSDYESESHNGRYSIMKVISRNRSRNLKKYSDSSTYNNGKLKIHTSVLEKLKNGNLKDYEKNLYNNFSDCFDGNDLNGYYKISDDCFDTVN